jgi:hypothetical protein
VRRLRGGVAGRAASRLLRILVMSAVAAAAAPAHAACLQQNAFYADRDRVASIAFHPFDAPGVSNRMTMLVGALALDGVAMWSEGVERPHAVLMHDCPEGDATGAEIAACTLWRGVVYAIDEAGEVGLLPQGAEEAAPRLLFPGLPWELALAAPEGGIDQPPWEVFDLTGCSGDDE